MQPSILEVLEKISKNEDEIFIILTKYSELAYLTETTASMDKKSNEYFDLTDGKIKDYLAVAGYAPFVIDTYTVYCPVENKLKFETVKQVLDNMKYTKGIIFTKDYKLFNQLKAKCKENAKVNFYNYWNVYKKDKLMLYNRFVITSKEATQYFESRLIWDTDAAFHAIVEMYNRQEEATEAGLREFTPKIVDLHYIMVEMLKGKVAKRGKFTKYYYAAISDYSAAYVYKVVRNNLYNLLKFKTLEKRGIVNGYQFYELQQVKLETYGLSLNKNQYFKLMELNKLVTLSELVSILGLFTSEFCSAVKVLPTLLYIGQRNNTKVDKKSKKK